MAKYLVLKQCPRTRPPHATGRTAQRAAAQLSGGGAVAREPFASERGPERGFVTNR
jgi:hypothetical protein